MMIADHIYKCKLKCRRRSYRKSLKREQLAELELANTRAIQSQQNSRANQTLQNSRSNILKGQDTAVLARNAAAAILSSSTVPRPLRDSSRIEAPRRKRVEVPDKRINSDGESEPSPRPDGPPLRQEAKVPGPSERQNN